MSQIRVGINGFGRIGRAVLKQLLQDQAFKVVGINDLAELDDLAYLCKYDSVHGWYPKRVEAIGGDKLQVGEELIPFYAKSSPEELPWGDLGADVVIEGTGAFRDRDKAAGHIRGGAKRVLISAPSSNADAMLVYGVNSHLYDPDSHFVVSNASCTTNCLAPVAHVLLENFGVEQLMITTVHAYTASQSLMDRPTRKRRRGRAAALSIIPTTTGAAEATAKILPSLEGKVAGMAMRVPIPDGSVTDIVARLSKPTSIDAVHEALGQAAESPELKGVLRVTDEALVSRDIIGDPHSSIVDSESTLLLGDSMIKLIAWYDNEWGYAARLVDMARLMTAS